MPIEMQAFVSPRSVALIGASPKEGSMGLRVLAKLVRSGIERIYPVNPKAESILGLKCYGTVADLPEAADLAFVLTPAETVPGVLRACAAKGIRAAAIASSGFGEVGGRGPELQAELAQIVRETGLRIVGPNCMGTYNVSEGLDLTISATLETVQLQAGPVAFISQSGAFGISLLMKGLELGIGFSKLFSLGNKVDLDDCAALEYLESDPSTRVIMIYMEGLTAGRKFLELASGVTKVKPIVVFKVGKHDAGARVMQSHTGALAGSYAVYSSAMRQAGIIEAESSFGMLEMAKALALQPAMKGNRVGIVCNTGGLAVEMADMFAERGLAVPVFCPELQERLTAAEAVPSYGSRANPVDFGAPSPLYPDWYFKSSELLLQSGEVDAVLVIFAGIAARWVAKRFQEGAPTLMQHGKPIVVLSIWKEEEMRELRSVYQSGGLPVVENPSLAGEAVMALFARGRMGGQAK